MAGIHEIARLAGVSSSTVSRVLNHPESVTLENREKVLSVIENSGVHIRKRSQKNYAKAILVVVPRIVNFYTDMLVKQIEKSALKKGYLVILCAVDEKSAKDIQMYKSLGKIKIEGAIIVEGGKNISKIIDKMPYPVVLFDDIPETRNNIKRIRIKQEDVGQMSIEYLLSQKCKNIVYLAENLLGNVHANKKKRYQGYRSVCEKYGLKEKNIWYKKNNKDEMVCALLKELPLIDGIIVNDEELASYLYKMLIKDGYKIPKDISIISMDSIHIGAFNMPEIASISYPYELAGRIAVNSIIDYKDKPIIEKEVVLQVAVNEAKKKKENTYEKTRNFK